MAKTIIKITHPLTPYCNKRPCQPGRKITNVGEKGEGTSTQIISPEHIPNCWAKQKQIDLNPLVNVSQINPFLAKTIATVLEKAPMEENQFNFFFKNSIEPLMTFGEGEINKIGIHLDETSFGDTDMSANLFLEWSLEKFIEKGARSLEEMKLVMVNPDNIKTFEQWVNRNIYSHMIADIEKQLIYASILHPEYHKDLIYQMMLCGINLLKGIGSLARLKEQFIALSFMADKEENILQAVAKSSLNYRGIQLTNIQKKKLLSILRKVTTIDTSMIRKK